MKVFRIKLNTNIYQRFLPTDGTIWKKEDLKLNCSPKLSTWQVSEVYVFNPKLKREERGLENILAVLSNRFPKARIPSALVDDWLEWGRHDARAGQSINEAR